MPNDRTVGALLLIGGVLGIVIYFWLLFSPYDILILKLTAGIAVAAIFGILSWIGYTLATTPAMPATVEAASPETSPQPANPKEEK